MFGNITPETRIPVFEIKPHNHPKKWEFTPIGKQRLMIQPCYDDRMIWISCEGESKKLNWYPVFKDEVKHIFTITNIRLKCK